MTAYIIFIIFSFPLYKILTNSVKWYKLNNFQKKYSSYSCYKGGDSPEWQHLRKIILERKNEIIAILNGYGIKDFTCYQTTETGYNHVEHKLVSILENLHYVGYINEIAVPTTVDTYLTQAIGISKKRIVESINPLYWLDMIIFLPKTIATYVGFPLDQARTQQVIKVLNILYWILIFILNFLGIHLLILFN